MLTVLHGDDSYRIERELDGLLQKWVDPAMAELNFTRLDGRDCSEEAVFSATHAMPFLAGRRVVTLHNPFARFSGEAGKKRFTALLDGLPDSTALILIIEDTLERGYWATLSKDHWLRRWVGANPDRAELRVCQLPQQQTMTQWIIVEGKSQGGLISPAAAQALAALTGNDTRTVASEITKLLDYVDRARPVEAADVEKLVAVTAVPGIFEMVDAMAAGNAALALKLLHRLLDEEDELSIFGMIVRQFRLLLLARELLDEGKGALEMEKVAHNEFVARKAIDQARRFSFEQLKDIYRRLLDIDLAVKTGQTAMPLALDTFIASLQHRS